MRLRYFFSSNYFVKKQISCHAKELFNTVLQVEKYEVFLPYCQHSKIINSKDKYFEAELKIQFNFYSLSYISQVDYIESPQHGYEIKSTCESGIFNYLTGIWNIKEIDEEKCEFQYRLDYKFQNPMYQEVSSYFQDLIGDQMVFFFTQEALKRSFTKKMHAHKQNQQIQSQNIQTQLQIEIQQKKQQLQMQKNSEIQQIIFTCYKNKLLQEKELNDLMRLKEGFFGQKISKGYNFYIQNKKLKNREEKFAFFLKDIMRESKFLK